MIVPKLKMNIAFSKLRSSLYNIGFKRKYMMVREVFVWLKSCIVKKLTVHTK